MLQVMKHRAKPVLVAAVVCEAGGLLGSHRAPAAPPYAAKADVDGANIPEIRSKASWRPRVQGSFSFGRTGARGARQAILL